MTAPSPPPPPPEGTQRTHDTKQNMQTWAYAPQKDPETAYWDACSALLRDRHCVPLVLGYWQHMLNRGHWNGHPWLKLRKTKRSTRYRVQCGALDAKNLRYTASSSQQTHRRSSIPNLLIKVGKLKVTVPSPPPPPTIRGRLLFKGGGGTMGAGLWNGPVHATSCQ